MRLRKKKTSIEDLGELDETPEDEIIVKQVVRRNRIQLSQQLIGRTRAENELIRRHLGVDDKGRCLRHPNQHVTGKVDKHRFESIHVCLICDSEIQAGGLYQRKSMKNVIDALNELQGDKVAWREKTNILYHGKAYDPQEDDHDHDNHNHNNKDGNDGNSVSSDNSLTHMLEFFDKGEDEKKKKKNKTIEEEEDEIADDEVWKNEVSLRVGHVRAWDGQMALRQNPTYAKYFRMMNVGIPLDAIKQAIALDELDPRIIDLDPNKPLQDQVNAIPDITEKEKEDVRKSDRRAFHTGGGGDNNDDEPLDIHETVDILYQAYVRRKQALQQLEEEMNPKKQTLKRRVKSLFQVPVGALSPTRKDKEKKKKKDKEKTPTDNEAPKVEVQQAKKLKMAVAVVVVKEEVTEELTEELKRESRVSFQDQTTLLEKKKVEETKDSMSSVPTTAEDKPEDAPQATTPTPAIPVMFYPAAAPLPTFEQQKKRKKPKKQFKSITKIGTVKYSIARTTEDLKEAKQELAQRKVITGSLLTQLQSLQVQLKEKDDIVEKLQHDLYDLDPDDPLVPRITLKEENPESQDTGIKNNVDRSDVVKKRLSKLPYTPPSVRLMR